MVSEENPQDVVRVGGEQDSSAPENQGEDSYDLVFDKNTNELTFKDPTTGRIITFKAKIKEKEEEAPVEEVVEEGRPLTPDEFRDALQKIDALGLSWTADLQPSIRAKTPDNEAALLSNEFLELQERYPSLPRELGSVVFHTLTGSKAPEVIVGNEEVLKQKVAAVHEFVITTDYRSEFFFKHAIKVPYFTDIDWEVVFKLGEKNVKGLPAISYALLSLLFHNPSVPGRRIAGHQTATVAVNEFLVNRLIEILSEVKNALESSRTIVWDERSKPKDEVNAGTANDQKQLV